MASRMDVIEKQIKDLWQEREREKAAFEAEAERLAEAEMARIEAQKVLPELREREVELWVRHDKAVEELGAVFGEFDALRVELGKAYAKPRRLPHTGFKNAVRYAVQRLKSQERKREKDPEAARKAQVERLKGVLKMQKAARRTMAGGGGSIEAAEQRIAETEALIRRLEGKERVPQEDDMTLAELAKQRVRFGRAG